MQQHGVRLNYYHGKIAGPDMPPPGPNSVLYISNSSEKRQSDFMIKALTHRWGSPVPSPEAEAFPMGPPAFEAHGALQVRELANGSPATWKSGSTPFRSCKTTAFATLYLRMRCLASTQQLRINSMISQTTPKTGEIW